MLKTSIAELKKAAYNCDDEMELIVSIENFVACLESVAPAEKQIKSAARRFLMSAIDDEKELLRRGARVYWEYEKVPVSIIAEVLFGDPKQFTKLSKLFPSDRSFSCVSCNDSFPVLSRNHFLEVRKAASKLERDSAVAPTLVPSILLCQKCKDEERAESSVEWENRREQERQRTNALASMPYREYLLTDEWAATRVTKLKQARFKCQLCNSDGLLNVHHRTYERRGHEDMSDLIVLCRPCHAQFHNKLP